MVANLRVEPDVETAKISWDQPQCYPSYQIQVMPRKECKGSYETCLTLFSPDSEGSSQDKTIVKEVDGLEKCTQYLVMARTTGTKLYVT